MMGNNKIWVAACGGYWRNRYYTQDSNLIILLPEILAGNIIQPYFSSTTSTNYASSCPDMPPSVERQLAGMTNPLIGRQAKPYLSPAAISFVAGIPQPSGQRKPELVNKRGGALILFPSSFFGATKTDWRGY